MLPFETVPKKLSICPPAIITAIPLVKPVTTLAGIKETIFPTLKADARSSKIPDRKDAKKTPCNPYCTDNPIKIALIAPVGPEI